MNSARSVVSRFARLVRQQAVTRPGLGAATLLAAFLGTNASAADEDAKPSLDDAEPAPAEKADAPATYQRNDEYRPREGTPLIGNKLFPMGGHFEFSGLFDYSFNDKYVQHTGGHASVGYHLFDSFGLEAFGGYVVGDETNIVGNVRNLGSSKKRANLPPGERICANPTCEPQLPDLWQTTWFTGATAQWAPIYGKISAVSEVDLNFQLYGLLGGGAEGVTKKLSDGSFAPAQVRPAIHYGLGVRIMPLPWLAVRAEVRNYNGLNPNVEEHEQSDEDVCTAGYILVVGNEKQCFTDFSSNTMLQVGVSFIL